VLRDRGDETLWDKTRQRSTTTATTTKKIVIDLSEQMLIASENGVPYMETLISTGLELTPTPVGTFTIFKKTPSRYMQGPIPGLADQQEYDMPGVPWNLYFTRGGAVIHGAYWHASFGSQYSHGCVNLSPYNARVLYEWAELGTTVIVKK
jgi:lipoprotein-anchoring transpeptidase ErfK/SrfK